MALPRLQTQLEAVNFLLEVIEESPVDNLENIVDPDVTAALRYLSQSDHEFQSMGWVFNTDEEYPLARDTSGFIQVPSEVLKLTATEGDIVRRGGRLYNREDRTFTFTSDVTARVIERVPFEDLSDAARAYVTLDAALRFHVKRGGDELSGRVDRQMVTRAWAVFHAEDTREGNYSFSGSQAIRSRPR